MANEPVNPINPANIDTETFGTPQVTSNGKPPTSGIQGLIEYGVQAETFKGLLSGQPNSTLNKNRGSLRSNLWGAGKIHDRAWGSAIKEHILDDAEVRQMLPPEQVQKLERFKELTRKVDKGPSSSKRAFGTLGESHALSPAEQAELKGLQKDAHQILSSQSPELREKMERTARHSQGAWRAGRLVNKGMNMAMLGSMGYDMGPTTGAAVGAGVMGLGVLHGLGSFANGYADARGHAGGFFGWQANKAMGFLEHAGERGLGNPLLDETTSRSAEVAARRASLGKAIGTEIKHEGFETVTRRQAMAAGFKKMTGRNHALGLSPRNFLLYGATIMGGAALSALTRAPVGGRLASRFAGSEQTMAMMNDPQNVEARMQAMSHLQSDTFSAAQSMGRESRYFLRQWNAPTDMYGLR